MEVLFKAKMRVVLSGPLASDQFKQKLDSIKVYLDSEKKDILSISASEIVNEQVMSGIVVVLSKSEKSYDLPTYIEKIRNKLSIEIGSDKLKLIDIKII